MKKEPRSEHARYAFGYSDRKPSRAWWIIHFIIFSVVIYNFVSVVP